MICKGVGIGLKLDPTDGEVVVVLSLHDDEDADDAAGIILLTPERAAQLSMSMMVQATTAQNITEEVMSTPMDDRPAKVAEIVERLNRGMN